MSSGGTAQAVVGLDRFGVKGVRFGMLYSRSPQQTQALGTIGVCCMLDRETEEWGTHPSSKEAVGGEGECVGGSQPAPCRSLLQQQFK